MKNVRIFLTLVAAGILFPACKSPQPEFGIPDDPKPGMRGKLFVRGESWDEKRHRWKVNEREKSKRMFERMKDEY